MLDMTLQKMMIMMVLLEQCSGQAGVIEPNIILMNMDDLGWGDLGVTGHPSREILICSLTLMREVQGEGAPRVLKLLPGFWSCSKGFGVKCENLSDLLVFYKVYFKSIN